MRKRRNFCDLGPWAYHISLLKNRLIRRLIWIKQSRYFAKKKSKESLPVQAFQHSSMILRKLGDVDMTLQHNKKTNLSLAVPKVHNVVIAPGEVFSFWRLVGSCTKRKGYKEGLVIKGGEVSSAIGGGMCQFSNLIHWLVLHSPLEIIEHHHHSYVDMFPDYGRKLPFGSGTSIMYNYLDYQFRNTTDQSFQLIITMDDEYLKGELRCERALSNSFKVVEKDNYFIREGDYYYRHNKIYRQVFNIETQDIVSQELLNENHAKVLYDASFIPVEAIRKQA